MRQDHVPGHEDVVDEVEERLAAQLPLELLWANQKRNGLGHFFGIQRNRSPLGLWDNKQKASLEEHNPTTHWFEVLPT